ncbi:DUF4233 domain-containing protein [Acidipropionibacterium virtanenii]|uniref:DUF4233 domain-containing protein n=1 Tax=Acidipropionibacterium virtanenii TaxID=2057246 RepID=A0A344UV59_9ACTN|nr:DUF4233 domain-containing protein [Acidipropionibacterium virtanenii]AXE39157.1 hypothetical protein JS278_02003 [Acidipropionibacterium virtanenii]
MRTGLENENPMVSPLAATLTFEAVVFVLAVPGMIFISELPAGPAIGAGALGIVLCLAALAGLRHGWGYPVGWLTQAVAVAMGLLTPMMYLVGAIFAVIWVSTFVLGRRLQSRRPAR